VVGELFGGACPLLPEVPVPEELVEPDGPGIAVLGRSAAEVLQYLSNGWEPSGLVIAQRAASSDAFPLW
jgi:hypothetical protein